MNCWPLMSDHPSTPPVCEHGRTEAHQTYIKDRRGRTTAEGPVCAGPDHPSTPPRLEDLAESIARLFHEHYERLAPEFGYSTREESRTPWPPPNADLMVATTLAVLTSMGAEVVELSIGGTQYLWRCRNCGNDHGDAGCDDPDLYDYALWRMKPELAEPGEYVVIRKDVLEGSGGE